MLGTKIVEYTSTKDNKLKCQIKYQILRKTELDVLPNGWRLKNLVINVSSIVVIITKKILAKKRFSLMNEKIRPEM